MRLLNIDFFDGLTERSQLELEKAKEAGKKVAGLYCIFAPKELVRATGAIPVGLCGKDQTPIQDAEAILPPNLCPLIKSSYGYAITDMCPYFHFSDFLIGETTCDGKKKMFELLKKIKPLFLLHLPPTSDENYSLDYWTEEIMGLKRFLEEQTGEKITDKSLKEQIRLHNKKRILLKKLIKNKEDYTI